jgi:uncharacterized membrane protein
LEVNQVLTRLLTVERLRVFSDSVLLVAITILAYNLTPPSLINGKLSGIETQSFLDNVYGLISSFFVISFFWLLYTKILDYVSEIDDIVVVISLIFFILVLLIPVFTLSQFQYKNLQSVLSLAMLQIVNGFSLLLLWTYLIKHRRKLMTAETGREVEVLSTDNNRYMYSRLALIPCIYLITIAIALLVSIQIASIFPVTIVPAVVLLAKAFGSKKKRKENAN